MGSTPVRKFMFFYVLAYTLRAEHSDRLPPSSGSKVFNQVKSTRVTMLNIVILEGYQSMKREQTVFSDKLFDRNIGHKS
jgi:hypothetical protein